MNQIPRILAKIDFIFNYVTPAFLVIVIVVILIHLLWRPA